MALFEKRYIQKVLLDDTEIITSQIENVRTVDGHTVSKYISIYQYYLSIKNAYFYYRISFNTSTFSYSVFHATKLKLNLLNLE